MNRERRRRRRRGVSKLPASMPTDEMPRGREQPLYDRAASYIERFINELGRSEGLLQKEIALACGLSEGVFSQKLRGNRSHFTEDEFERVAVFFRRRTGRPLIGYPHLEWTLMESCDRKVGGWKP